MLTEALSVKHIKNIFKTIDKDNNGTITITEMMLFSSDEDLGLQNYFEALDISATDTITLFELLDRDGSGEVDINEFCDGCSRLRGEATSFDINTLLYET